MKKRILLTASRFFPYAYGGGEVYVAAVASELQKNGWDVHIATLGERQEKQKPFIVEHSVHDGVNISAMCLHEDTLSEFDRYTGTSDYHRTFVRDVIENFHPSIVHVNGLTLPSLTVADELHIPAVLTVHHSGVACPAGDLIRPDDSQCQFAEHPGVCIPCASSLRQRQWYTGGIIGRIPRWLYTAVGKRTEHARDLSFALRVLRYPWLVDRQILYQKKMWEFVRHIVVPSQAMKELLLRNGVDKNHIHVIPHGVRVAPAPRGNSITRTPVRFGFVGQIARNKGLHLIFQALNELKDDEKYEFHIFGEARSSEEKKYYADLIRQHPRVSIRDHGYVPHDRIYESYDQVDVVIVPSLAYEAFCLVVHEAFCALKPVIAARSGALPELVEHGINGLIFDRNSVPSLTKEIRSIVQSPGIVDTMKKHIRPVKSFSEYTREIEAIYQQASG